MGWWQWPVGIYIVSPSPSPSPFSLEFGFGIWDLDLGPGFGTWIWDLDLGLDLGLTKIPLLIPKSYVEYLIVRRLSPKPPIGYSKISLSLYLKAELIAGTGLKTYQFFKGKQGLISPIALF